MAVDRWTEAVAIVGSIVTVVLVLFTWTEEPPRAMMAHPGRRSPDLRGFLLVVMAVTVLFGLAVVVGYAWYSVS